jgi:hypothetical protein
MELLEAHFPRAEFKHLYPPAASVAHWLYNYGRRFALGRAAPWDRDSETNGAELWQDAEQYLQILDNAASSAAPSWARRLGRIVQTHVNRTHGTHLDLAEINGAARRLLAAECSAFTKDLDLLSEPAIPYVNWAGQLQADHTVVSFNYDRLVELLGKQTQKIQCVVPGQDPPSGVARAYKLHGSVDWLLEDRVNDPQMLQHSPDSFAALNCERNIRLVIGSPGLTKSKVTELLHEKMWEPAGKALAEAETIVFVGYRLPATDCYAQKFLLDAIYANQSDHPSVHIVLGPNNSSEDCARLGCLLRFALRKRQETPFDGFRGRGRFSLRPWPLYAADFLGQAGAIIFG